MNLFRLLFALVLLLLLPAQTTLAASGVVCGGHGAVGSPPFPETARTAAGNGHDHRAAAVFGHHDGSSGQHSDRTANCATCGAVSLLFAPSAVLLSLLPGTEKTLPTPALRDPNPFLDTLKRPPKLLVV